MVCVYVFGCVCVCAAVSASVRARAHVYKCAPTYVSVCVLARVCVCDICTALAKEVVNDSCDYSPAGVTGVIDRNQSSTMTADALGFRHSTTQRRPYLVRTPFATTNKNPSMRADYRSALYIY